MIQIAMYIHIQMKWSGVRVEEEREMQKAKSKRL